jgi:DNA-binding CsgD family transcriptional regulator
MEIAKGYQLRAAAGQYWLLNMEQKGVPYQGPVVFNAMGAEIWNRLQKGKTSATIAEELSIQYETSSKEILEDVLEFCEQLKKQGIIIEK